jgi:hypothetical protein
VRSPSAAFLAAAVLALPAPLIAQEQALEPPAKLPVIAAGPVVPVTPEITFGAWQLRPDVMLKGESPRPSLDGVPRWHLGFRAERQLFSRLSVGGMAILSRGEDGPVVSSVELGSGRDLSQTGSLSGPGTYRTVFNTALTFSVPLKETGRVNLKAFGELWNPFGDKRTAEPSSDVALVGRAFKIGVRTTF